MIAADMMIMDEHQTQKAIVDRLAAEFPGRSRPDVERIVGESWGLFAASRDDVVLRVIVTEWYARNQLVTLDAAATAC